jgi:hypothetical protein
MGALISRLIPHTLAVAVNAVYRESGPGARGWFNAIELAHVDFNSAVDAMDSFHGDWAPRVPKGLYHPHYLSRHHGMASVWLPLDDRLRGSRLVFSPIDKQKLLPYRTVRRNGQTFWAKVVVDPTCYDWFTPMTMGLGQGILFQTLATPHAAVTLGPPALRRSIELRFLLFRTAL